MRLTLFSSKVAVKVKVGRGIEIDLLDRGIEKEEFASVPLEKRAEIVVSCRNATLGCVDCKKILASCMVETLAPFRIRAPDLWFMG